MFRGWREDAWGGGGTWLSWCVYEGVAGCAGARSPVRARLHGLK